VSEEIVNCSEWYKDVQYKDAKNFIRENINAASRSFVAIGYYLKYIRDKKLYEQDGYQNIWEFAQAEFGISKSSASRFMAINDRFSVDGNSPILQDRYKDFSSSKLSEMLTMIDEQLEQVTVTTTVAEIREIKNPDKVVATSQQEPEKIAPAQFNAESEKSKSTLNAAEILDMIMNQPESHLAFLIKRLSESISTAGIKSAINDFMIFHTNKGQKIKSADYLHDYGHMFYGQYGKPFEKVKLHWDKSNVMISADEFMELYLKYISLPEEPKHEENKIVTETKIVNDHPEVVDNEPEIINDVDESVTTEVVEAEIIEEKPVETKPYHSAEYYLREAIRNEEKQIEAMRDYWKEYQPDTLLKHETILRALKSYLADINSEQNPPEQIQPELPILRNNDQRAAWIDAFETWPIWIDTKETEERYYRYDLPDGNSIVVKVYYTRLFDYKSTGLKYEERFKDGWGDEEYYLLEPNKHFKQCRTNRSYLIDYLKELQRKKGDAYAAGNS